MKKDYDVLAKQILEQVGGRDNISSVMHCYTRLRINLKDSGLANVEALEKLDIIGTQFSGEQLQIIIGNDVNEVYNAFANLVGLEKETAIPENLDKDLPKKKRTIRSVLSAIVDGIVGCMIPILPMLIASGILKAIVLLAEQFGLANSESGTIVLLSLVADAAFYFMPVIIGGFAARKFGANIALGSMLGAALIHPTFVSLVTEGSSLSVFGIPVYSTSYDSSVVPIILSVWVMSYIERFISKHSPKSLRSLIEPVLTIIIMIPLMFSLLAPLGAILSVGFANLLTWFYGTFGMIAVAVFCAIIPWVVMLGMHIGTVPISISSIAASGVDKLMMPAFLISNFTQGAACMAVGIKAKTTNLKSLAFTSSFSNLVPGVSEPGMYGITLRYKTPMWGAMIGAAVGGLYFGFTEVGAFSFLPPNIFALAGYVGTGEYSHNLMNTIIGIVIGMVVSFIATMILYKPENQEQEEK
ncbi:PTS transporter subunit EIIC [Tetragenococcus halophilus]|uniref:PTS transporter subunit EIIC n=1 Tax=Tetragenococcus halophilus TaxID=51669 RepID=UPI00209AA1D4|nr:PTS transporter subunit EIIC [Tetragenococcus halophilus]MCO8292573.1 PTS transporter subunit EIIC [Tetragenococcus halophilus]